MNLRQPIWQNVASLVFDFPETAPRLGSFLLPAVEDQIKVFQLAAQGPAGDTAIHFKRRVANWSNFNHPKPYLKFTSALRPCPAMQNQKAAADWLFTNLTCDSWRMITALMQLTAKRSPTALLPNQIWIKSQHCLSSKDVSSAHQISCK